MKLLHFTQILFENVTQEKIHNPSYSRRSPPSASVVIQQPNPKPNINLFEWTLYVQLGNWEVIFGYESNKTKIYPKFRFRTIVAYSFKNVDFGFVAKIATQLSIYY